VNTFLQQLESTGMNQTTQTILDRLRAAPQRVLMLDYDGTLVPLVQRPEMAAPDAELLELLRQLASQPGTSVHVVSGRPREVLEAWLGQLPIGLHAEHGLWSRLTPREPWRRLEGISTTWMNQVRPVLDDFVARTPSSFTEQKSASLTWHYRQAGPEGELQANELRRYLANLLADEGLADTLEVMPGNKVIEIRPHGMHKGRVVGTVLSATPGHPLAAAFGDDRTDEDLFASLPAGALAVHIGPTPSQAPVRLPSSEDLRALLWTLASAERRKPAGQHKAKDVPSERH
jgi:trehalose 6-phosphate synthase/phosphatase